MMRVYCHFCRKQIRATTKKRCRIEFGLYDGRYVCFVCRRLLRALIMKSRLKKTEITESQFRKLLFKKKMIGELKELLRE